jgi:hypothetical protein
VAAGNRSNQPTHQTSWWSGRIDPWQQHSAGRRCSTRRASHLGSATLLVNRERPTLVSGAACHRDIRCIRRHDGHAIRGNRERLDGSRCPRPEGRWTPFSRRSVPPGNQGRPSRHPTVVVSRARRPGKRPSGATERGRCAQRQGHSTSKGGISDAPREMQLANWGSSTSGPYSPRESVPVALWVRQRSGRCSHGLPPPQGFLSRTREERLRVLNLLELRRTPDPKVMSEAAPRGLTCQG